MILNALFNIFAPAPYLPEIQDKEKVKQEYTYWRYRMFYSMLFGYALYYFTRKSLNSLTPGLTVDLGFSKSDLGILGTTISLTYGMGKFVSGMLADKSNPRYLMPLGLFLTGLCNIFFGMSSSLGMFIVFWGMNGVFQGFGWPACARSLTNWYSHSERGAWWASTSVAHNLGGFVTPWIVGACLEYFGWRFGMYLPGIVCMIGAFVLINRLRDAPQTLGLPSIEKFRNDEVKVEEAKPEIKPSNKELLVEVLKNKWIWLLGFVYFFVYILRTGIGDWTILFLNEVKGYGALGSSGTSSLFEAGGFCGCLLAGWISDRLFEAKRVPVCVLYSVGILGSVFLFWIVPAGYLILDCGAIFLMGFMVFGPQMLIGIAASEMVDKRSAATANGFVGWIAYIGSAVAGYPIGKLIDSNGWNGAFIFLMICAFLLIVFLLPLWTVQKPAKAVAQATS